MSCALEVCLRAVKGWKDLPLLRQIVLPSILGLAIAVSSPIARAQSFPSQNQGVDEQPLVRLENTRHPLAIEANAAGRVEGGRALRRMLLVLSPGAEQEDALNTLLDEQQTRNSPNYHHWLTAAEFGARFGAADADVQRVRAWLEGAGFTVERVAGSKRWVEFSGTAEQVESTFHTVMEYYRVNGKTYLANSTDLAVPAGLSGNTRGVVSLNNFGKRPPLQEMHGMAGRTAKGVKTKLMPGLTASGTPNTYYNAPGDFAAIYNTTGLLNGGIDGTGVAIAVTAQSDIELTDVQQFRQIFGLKANDPNIYVSGPDPGIADLTDSEEAMLDVEWAGAVAPGATINLVVAGTTDTTSGVDLAATYAIDNEVAPIVTYTYGSCESALGTSGNAFYNALWEQAAAEGITVLVASGDNGSAGCDNAMAGAPAALGFAVNGVASTPYNVAVGGTEFADGSQQSSYWNATNTADYASAIGYIPEAAWNESCDPGQAASATNCAFGNVNFSLLASAGGASTVYSKPLWQSGTGVPADNARDLPDVALAAASLHDQAVFCTSLAGTPCQINAQQEVVGLTLVGGTSASTPAMAGILALLEQKNGTFQGQVNYVLYRLAQTNGNSCDSSTQTNPKAVNSCVFYDVTTGSNMVPCAGGSPGCSSTQNGTNGFMTGNMAGVGYDLVTGLGSVNATNLATEWKNISLAQSQTTLQTSSASLTHGTAITLNGSVLPASGSGSPTGTVSIKTDQHGDLPQRLNLGTGGTFSGMVSDLPGGQYNVFAYYAGDSTYGSSSSSLVAVNVTPENSTTTLAASASGTVAYGAAVQLTATVAGVSGQGAATGTVTIQDSGNNVGTYGLAAAGTATIPTGGGSGYSFAPGTHSLTAVYSGDNSFNSSTSAAVGFTIGKGTPFVVIGVNTNTMAAGDTLGAHVVVSGSGTAEATGTVQFTVDGVAYGAPVTLQSGGFFGTQAQASALIATLTQGTHVIAASYNGSTDPNYASVAIGDPTEFTQTVTVGSNAGNKTTTSLAIKTAPMNLGDTGVYTVLVSPGTATGTVTLWDAVGPRSAATTIGGGTATIQFAWTQAGTASLYAVYSGDAVNAGSASAPVTFTVQQGTPQVKLVAPTNASPDQQVSLNTSVSGNPGNSQLPYPTGIVEFWDSLNGGSAQLLTVQSLTLGAGGIAVSGVRLKLVPGTHSLYVHYRGDTNWQAANSATMPLLDAATFSLSVSPNPIAIAAGSPGTGTISITPGSGFAGTVALTCASGGTFVPAGYTCSFGNANVPVNGGVATTTLTFTPSSAAAGAVKSANVLGTDSSLWGMGFGAGLLLLGLLGFGAGELRSSRNFLLARGLVLCVSSCVLGCGGGGGGGGGGPVPTTTTIVSTNLNVAFGTPVTFTVTVKPNGAATPSGLVQLYDNGQAFLSEVKVNAGIATFQAATLPVGVHNLTAQYLGDASTQGSASAPIQQVITGQVPMQISGVSGATTEVFNFTVVVN